MPEKQAGAELCQAQGKLKLVWLLLTFEFANFHHEFNFGALLLLGFGRLGFEGLVYLAS